MIDGLVHLITSLTGWVAILMPALILWVIFYYVTREKIKKYEAMVEIAKNLDDPSDVEDLLENFKENKKPIDYRRTGVITIFVGFGLYLFGLFNISILKGVGLLVICVGFGSLVAGYIYPNNTEEIDKAVEKFEKK
jgi:phage-related holin